ncbi:MAG: hypothetical protein HYW37_02250 [Candidatus Colwellbacteria bacterium]|nr:hypothetical protein [Candidatus Colwellbacteria bacterium]
MKKANLKYTALILATLIASPLALAAETPQPGSIDKSVSDLGNVKDDTELSPEEKLVKELDARINILNDVISLSLKEIASQADKLEKLPRFADFSREKEMRGGFLADLDGYRVYFEDQSQKLSGLIGSNEDNPENLNGELKGLAKEIKDYRDNVYNSGIAKVIEFTLLYYNEGVLGTAKTRLAKISADIGKLEGLGLIEKGSVRSRLDKASGLIATAQDLHSQAKKLVLTSPPGIDPEKPKVIKPKNAPRELIEKSLANIKSSYDIFIRVSKDTRRILGIN